MIDIMNGFLNERRANWLEPRLKKASNDEEITLLEQEANEKFSIVNWLPDAARRAGQLSITTHPSKFTHPSAKSTSIIANAIQRNDGYLRSGNVQSELDVFGNAAAMDVYKFLFLPTTDRRTLLNAFEDRDETLQKLITNIELDFERLRADFLKIKIDDDHIKTDRLLKQVYFPVLKDQHEYHLLSLLTASGLISTMKSRIDSMRFSEEAKESRIARRKGEESNHNFSDIFDLVVTGYGGTKPQNISVLNTQNAGKAYLLPCIPPLFEKRLVRLPTTDFLSQSIYLKREKKRFITLHQWAKQDRNNKEVRETIKKIIQGIIDQVLYKAYQLRQVHPKGWSESEHYTVLPKTQRIWLDNFYEEYREQEDNWRDDIAHQIASHMVAIYENINKATILGDDELAYIKKMIDEKIKQDKEFF